MKSCLICRSDVKEFGRNNGYIIFKCLSCGLGFTENSKIQSGSYHRDEEYIEEEKLFKNIFLKRINIISKFKDRGKALEIGCSTGLMLSLLKMRGWEVKGIEISRKSAKVAQSRGIEVTVEPFEKVDIKEVYDLIILNHTLEHLDNPLATMKKISTRLKKDGILYIDVPNFGSLSANILKGNWPLLLSEEHKWHFTKLALKKLMDQSGFKVIFVDRSSGIWNYNNPILGVFLSFVTLKKRFFTEVITAIPSLILSQLGLGSDLMIIAKKI